MSHDEVVEYTIADGVAEVLLRRPKQYNSFSEDLRRTLAESLQKAEADPSVKAVLLRGDGPGFCAGADLSEPPKTSLTEQLEKEYKPIFKSIIDGKKLYIAAVHGSAAGIGAALAMACDFLVMCENSRLSLIFTNIGLIPDGGSHWSLYRKLGYNKALEVIINGEHISCELCEKYGLANKIFKVDTFLEDSRSWTSQLVKRAPLASMEAKQLLRKAQDNSFWSVFNSEASANGRLAETEDFRNAVKAFFNKQKPVFVGK